ncbi:unnamed protein product [Rotaria sp. Silwood1]|nr:unnamed protein product [Rotaria sp. Silwood1]
MTTKKHINSMIDYTSYKYLDIQKKWIICEGHLHYYYHQIKLLNISQFAMYYVVLAKIPIEDDKQFFVMYLYQNQKHKPSKIFQLDAYERLSGQCSKTIKSKYALFELIGKDKSDSKIFGVSNIHERDKWIKHIRQILNRTNQNYISNDLHIIHPDLRQNWKEDLHKIDHINSDVTSVYEPFASKRRPTLSKSRSTSILHHRPPPPIPNERYINSNENNQREIQQYHHSHSSQTTDNIYLSVTKIPQCLINEHNKRNIKSQSNFDIKTKEDFSTSLDNQSFTWDDIFYANEFNDHAHILNKISQIGAFLVRPHSLKTNSNYHDYTLNIYAYGEIIKYKILVLENDKYSLVGNNSQPCFFTIPDLCQYYTNHQLPRSTLRIDSTQNTVENIYLKWPYTYYEYNQRNKF